MEVKSVTKTDKSSYSSDFLYVFFCFFLSKNRIISLESSAKCELVCAFRRQTPKLGMAKVTQVDFPPRELVSYTKETQTPVMTQQKEGESRNRIQGGLELTV